MELEGIREWMRSDKAVKRKWRRIEDMDEKKKKWK